MELTGDSLVPEYKFKNFKELVEVLKVLANPVRLKIIALLAERPMYVTEIAKELRLPYPLVHLYLSKLEEIKLVKTKYEFVKAERPHIRKYCILNDFVIKISPELIRNLIRGDKSE